MEKNQQAFGISKYIQEKQNESDVKNQGSKKDQVTSGEKCK